MIKCRCCGANIKSKPLLQYKNMPRRAQFFPDQDQLSEDKGVDLDIYECEKCGLMQISGEPVSYYRDVIRAAAVSEEMREFRIKQFSDFIKEYDLANKRIVEIGCGNGEFMQFMKAAGGNVYGIEHSAEAVERCKNEGLMVEQGFPEGDDFCISQGPFDGFYIMNFLEHIPDPKDFLRAIFANLNDEAIGLIEVPNTDMIIDKMMFSEFMLDHLSYFTEGTLERLLEISGFHVLECKPVWHDYCLSAIVRKRKKNSLQDFYDAQENLIKEITDYISSYTKEGKKVAVWGAGHQALAVMAMADITDKIEYVVDSADFKQGKFTPGSHIKVVSPQKFFSDDIDAVIVMAASYSDEVRGVIVKNKPEVDVVVLRDIHIEH